MESLIGSVSSGHTGRGADGSAGRRSYRTVSQSQRNADNHAQKRTDRASSEVGGAKPVFHPQAHAQIGASRSQSETTGKTGSSSVEVAAVESVLGRIAGLLPLLGRHLGWSGYTVVFGHSALDLHSLILENAFR